MKAIILIGGVLSALIVAGSSVASSSTTAPSRRLTIVVRITDQGFRPLAQFSWLGTDRLKVLPQSSVVPRGDYATFNVYNEGNRPHNFQILGRKTATLRHGDRARFNIYFKTRGTFEYSSTLDAGKSFRGQLSVN